MLRRSLSLFNIKPIMSAKDAVADIKSHSTLAIGGFGASGNPDALCRAIVARGRSEVRNLSIYGNAGAIGTPTTDAFGIGRLYKARMVRRVACSHFGSNSFAEREFFRGYPKIDEQTGAVMLDADGNEILDTVDDHAQRGLEIEFVPQGTLAERMRAGGAGIPAFWTRTSAGTILQQGGIPSVYCPREKKVAELAPPKETRYFEGVGLCVLEEAIHADYGLLKAEFCDRYGNCFFKSMSRNFSGLAAQCSKVTIVEVKRVVDSIPPDNIHLPGIYIDRIVCDETTNYPTFIEKLTLSHPKSSGAKAAADVSARDVPKSRESLLERLKTMPAREKMQRRAALELMPQEMGGYATITDSGLYVNLGIGLPTGCVNFICESVQQNLFVQSENGLIGAGPSPSPEQLCPETIDAGKACITARAGAATFASDTSFGMIRSGKIALTMLGGLQVAEDGSLANWFVDGEIAAGPGGAMDLVTGCKKIILIQSHVDKKKRSKLLRQCHYPLTGGRGTVHRVITDLAVFDFENGNMVLKEIAPDSSLEEVKQKTEARFVVADSVKEMPFSWVVS